MVKGHRSLSVNFKRKSFGDFFAVLSKGLALFFVRRQVQHVGVHFFVSVGHIAVLAFKNRVAKTSVPAGDDRQARHKRFQNRHGMHFRKRSGDEHVAQLIVGMNFGPGNIAGKNYSVAYMARLFFQSLNGGPRSDKQNFYLCVLFNHAHANVKQFLNALFFHDAAQKQKDDVVLFDSPLLSHGLNFFFRNRALQKGIGIKRVWNYRRRSVGQHKGHLKIVARFLGDINQGVEFFVQALYDFSDYANGYQPSAKKIVLVKIFPKSVGCRDYGNMQFFSGKLRRVGHKKFRVRVYQLNVVLYQKF